MSHSTGLPQGWEVRHSNSKNLPYYFNTSTRESCWEPPAGTDSTLLKTYMSVFHSTASQPNAASHAQTNGTSTTSTSTSHGTSTGDAPEKIRAAHLLVKHRDSRRPSSWKESQIHRTKSEAYEIINGYRSQINSGGVSLGQLATRESDCSSARKQGDLGFFGKGDMQKEFEEAAFALRPGEMSGVVETASGLHLIERLE